MLLVFVLSPSQEDMPAILTSRPQTGLSFLAPEPEDLEDLYSRYKVWRLDIVYNFINLCMCSFEYDKTEGFK